MRVHVVWFKGIPWYVHVLAGWMGVVVGISNVILLPIIAVIAFLSGALIVRWTRPSPRAQSTLLPPAAGGLTLGPATFWIFDGPLFVAGIALFALGTVSWAILAYAAVISAASDQQK